MLNKYKERYIIAVKSISVSLICFFVFSNIAFALSPKSSLSLEQFKDEYFVKTFLLSHESVNKYISIQINPDNPGQIIDLNTLGNRYQTEDINGLEIGIVSIDGLLRNTGQIAHLGLGRKNNKPVIYIDSRYFYNQQVREYEEDKIAKWERLREKRHFSYAQMRDWIIKYADKVDPDAGGKTSRAISKEISLTIRHRDYINGLYAGIKTQYRSLIKSGRLADAESLLNFANMYNFYREADYLLDRDSKNINLAAHVEDKNEGGGPYIGYGFKKQDLDNLDITLWNTDEVFKRTVNELEKFLYQKAPPDTNPRLRELLRGMQETLQDYKNGKEGKVLGIAQSRYDDEENYYLGFATPKRIGLGKEFFNINNPLYRHRLEALFHELFHAAFGKSSEENIEEDIEIHLYALKLQAQFFWGLRADHIEWATSKWLAHHPANTFWDDVYNWKKKQRDLAGKLAHDNWKALLTDLRYEMKFARRHPTRFLRFLAECDRSTNKNPKYPIESRYPLLRAVALLEKDEKTNLIDILNNIKNARKLTIVDSILLMIDKDIPKAWAGQQTPNLLGRTIWEVAAEIWKPAGGLGRVEQFHGMSMKDLLQTNVPLCTLEGYYEGVDYASILGVKKDAINEIGRFEVWVGGVNCTAICYEAILPSGIKAYFIKGFKSYNMSNPFFTKGLYDYADEDDGLHDTNAQKCSKSEFSAFFSTASLEFIRRMEIRNRSEDRSSAWKEPVIHFNDGQLGLAPLFRKIYYKGDEILKGALIAYSTHTYGNRCFWDQNGTTNDDGFGIKILKRLMIAPEYWKYFNHQVGEEIRWVRELHEVIDFTSAGVRTADWVGGVSAKHVDDVLMYDYWPWGTGSEWEKLQMIAVTNGDRREITAHKFIETMKETCGDDVSLDIEYPTVDQILKTKILAKEKLNTLIKEKIKKSKTASGVQILEALSLDSIDPTLPLVSYSGRIVEEKAGRSRAFSDLNMERMIEAGINIVIGANTGASDATITNELELLMLMLATSGNKYRGKFILMRDINIEDQRTILAATDIQIQDSDQRTEAAGYSEADAGACGALEMTPSWREGLLQAQGITFNPDILGEGNTIIPKDGNPDSYLDILMTALRDKPKKFKMTPLAYLAAYQVNAIKLSQILDARMTAAEYLRQWSNAVAKIKERSERIAPAKITIAQLGGLSFDQYVDAVRNAASKSATPKEILAIDGGPKMHGAVEALKEAKKDLSPAAQAIIDKAIAIWGLKEIKNSYILMSNALNKEVGILLDEKFESLKELGIFVPVEDKQGYYRFADMMVGPDENYTKTLLNAIMGERPPLTKELVKMVAVSEMEKEFVVPEGRTMYHIIEQDVIPFGQRSSLVTEVNKFFRDNKGPEHIIIKNGADTVSGTIAEIRAKDANAIIDVALADESRINSVPDDKDIKMLVFKTNTDFIDLLAVLKALRALHSEDALSVLLRLYSVMAGEPYKNPPQTVPDDPKEFARKLIFDLPSSAPMPADDIPKLNARLIELLTAA